jgi:hypothetical protein
MALTVSPYSIRAQCAVMRGDGMVGITLDQGSVDRPLR